MAENFNIFDFRLSDEDMKDIATLDSGRASFLTTATRQWSNQSAKESFQFNHTKGVLIMEKRILGKSGLEVSALGLGCMD